MDIQICNLDFTDPKIAAAVLETAKRVRNTLPSYTVHVALPQMIDGVDFESGDTRKAVITVVDCDNPNIQNKIMREFMFQLIGQQVDIGAPFYFN